MEPCSRYQLSAGGRSGDLVALSAMSEEFTVGKASVFLNAVLTPFRATGIQRGSRLLIDFIPPRLFGGEVIWIDTDAGPLVLRLGDTSSREFLIFSHPRSDVEETRIICALCRRPGECLTSEPITAGTPSRAQRAPRVRVRPCPR
jgi:hypothetical protein